MKRVDLKNLIGARARDRGLLFVKLRNTGEHEVHSLDGLRIVIPKKREINDLLAESIMKQCEAKLGARWWR
jgi:hypothetical protein